MACIRYIYTCTFVLTMIAAHVFPFAKCRQLKALENEKFNSFADETGESNHAKKTTQTKNIPPRREGEFQVAPPTPSDDIVSGGEVASPPASTNKSPEFGITLSSSTNDFKPTAPGNSRGIGHGIVGGNDDNQQKPPSNHSTHKLSSTPGDFKPTAPGRSPGVGHSFQTMKKDPNA